MCIAVISTAHPSYPLIIIDNRDEYLRRPTSAADWWPDPNAHILSSRDLARASHGTWMGVTSEGKVAVLTNYREQTADQATGVHSRGAIVNRWLTAPPGQGQGTREFVQELVGSSALNTVGGFSLVCGYVDEPLAIVSNRASDMEHIAWVASEKGQTRGLSNTSFGDRSWPKIPDGERLLDEAVEAHVRAGEDEDEDALIARLLQVLSTDTLPQIPEHAPAAESVHLLRKSIFVPVIGAKEESDRAADEIPAACVQDKTGVRDDKGGELDQAYMSGAYGTQKQTVLLMDATRRVRYFERTLYDNEVNPIPAGKGDRSFEFVVDR
ncbi:DUF833 domain protein [Aspergillus sp. HF37]|nr:DUF833 domain protein [Aspergillus sp. HF37]